MSNAIFLEKKKENVIILLAAEFARDGYRLL